MQHQIKCFDNIGSWSGWVGPLADDAETAVMLFSHNSKELSKKPSLHPARVELWERPENAEGWTLKMVYDSRGVVEASKRFDANWQEAF